ncbi:MAG: FHA domain-containing protein [Elusimicrobia bacterium]|nr:FHA domain-containing protein [Elusimicrobiota bacterium]
MLQLTVKSPLSFQWIPLPPQWRLRSTETDQKSALMRDFPFVVGRAENCQLVLPDSAELRKTTSRWHCYIAENAGRYFIADGSFDAVPETGAKKPSISGTFHNGRRLKEPEAIAPGDTISAGPWDFKVGEAGIYPVNIDDALKLINEGKRSIIKMEELKSPAGYQRLHELLMELGGFDNIEDSLAHVLAFAARKVPAAEVIAILLENHAEGPAVRLAWQKKQGRVLDFQFSSSLLERLRVREPFLLEPGISSPSRSQKLQNITSALLVPLWSGRSRLGVLYMDNRGKGGLFTEDDLYLCTALGSVVSLQLLMEKQLFLGRLEENLKQYFSANVVRRLVEEAGAGKQPELGVSEKTAAILFVDMQGFSEFCRTHEPLEVSGLLNPYFMLMSECIHRHGGYVDKFIGDAVMGVFEEAGAGDTPAANSSCALRAARAAREMIKAWRGRSASQTGKTIPLRVGLDAGRVVIGNVGFPGRLEYTAIGDAVNTASRLQNLAPPDGIAVTDAVRSRAEKEFRCKKAGLRKLKGCGEIEVWNIDD